MCSNEFTVRDDDSVHIVVVVVFFGGGGGVTIKAPLIQFFFSQFVVVNVL